MQTSLQSQLQDLGDLDVAALLSLTAEQHLIVNTTQEGADDVLRELRLVATETFGLNPAVVECSHATTVDQFSEAMLVEVDDAFEDAVDRRDGIPLPTFSTDFSSAGDRPPARFGSFGNTLDNRRIAPVIIVRDLDLADENVQVQALELLRSRRIFTRLSMHLAPKDMLFIAVLTTPRARLSHHLNHIFMMSHRHLDDADLPHLEGQISKREFPIISFEGIRDLRALTEKVALTARVAEYIHDIVIFLRNSRYVKEGVTATATRQMRLLSRALAPLHNASYITPSFVALAARKIYPHRLVLATAESEKSLQWGSDPDAVRELLQGIEVEDVIEDVLASIEAPL